MRRLELDYQRKPNNITLLGIVVCILAISVLAVLALRFMQVSEESQIAEIELHQLDSKTSRQTDSMGMKQDARIIAKEIKQANKVLKMLGMGWDGVFAAVAAAQRNGVALLALAPEPEKRIVKISAEAKNFSVMLDYIKRLEKQSALGEVNLQSHQIQKRDPQKPVRFVVLADWIEK
ncbi:MAG: hypothetical protein R8M11_00950 [Gallionella sp.]